MNLQDFLNETRIPLRKEIIRQCSLLANTSLPNAQIFAKHLEEFTLRGKLLRGSLVKLSVEAFGEWNQDFISVAAALELAQSALLIHDDIMDHDDTRRGKASMHKILSKEFNTSPQTGDALALCLADATLFFLFSFLAPYPNIVTLFAQELTRTALGQSFDIQCADQDKELSAQEISIIAINKTAHYTFVLPFLIGNVLTNSSHTEALTNLGELMGNIFQIRDDELNFLPQSITGKESGGDIRENKKTLCRLELLKEFPHLKTLFGSEDGIKPIQQHYRHSQAEAYVSSLLQSYQEQSLLIIDSLPLIQHKEIFIELVRYLKNRVL